MTEFLLSVFALECAALIGWGMLKKGRIYEFPFLAGVVFAGFLLPQAIGMSKDPELPHGALDKTLVMAILCSFMCWAGYVVSSRPMKKLDWTFNRRRLKIACFLLVAGGGFWFFRLTRLPREMTEASNWTGLPVMYLFFANMLSYGFAIAILWWYERKSAFVLALALLGSAFYLDRIIIAGRRGVASELLMVCLVGWFFARKKSVPRFAMLGLLFVGMLLVHSIGEYRSAVLKSEKADWEIVWDIDYIGNVNRIMNEGSEEVRNAVYMIHGIDRTKQFDYGVFHWNTLVFNYVPAQVLGKDFKESLMIEQNDDAYLIHGYKPIVGSTATGLVDCYKSFWYFGCLKFFVIAWVMRKLWEAGTRQHFVARIFYVMMLTNSLHCITHHTNWFLSPWVHMGIFLMPLLWWAKDRRGLSATVLAWAGRAPEAMPRQRFPGPGKRYRMSDTDEIIIIGDLVFLAEMEDAIVILESEA